MLTTLDGHHLNSPFFFGLEISTNIWSETSSTLATTAEPTAKTTAVQHKSLGSPAKVVLDNRITLNYLLANKAGICAIANTSCCTWIKTSGIVETQTRN